MPVILSGALPLTYPAALGLRPSDRPPPFALQRSYPYLAGSVAHQPHPICAQKPLVLVTELSANPIGAQKPFISGTKCWLLLYSFPETVILGHGLRAERTLMGKVKFQGRHLARISATQVLPMGKVPTTKLDLAR